MNCRLCLLNCGLFDDFGRQSLQVSSFPGGSLGTSVFEVAIGEKCQHFSDFPSQQYNLRSRSRKVPTAGGYEAAIGLAKFRPVVDNLRVYRKRKFVICNNCLSNLSMNIDRHEHSRHF
jgi:hypothetical protein